jgi:hypothetical protein
MNQFLNGMRDFGENIIIIVNSLLLLIAYIIGVGISALFSKIFKKKFLDLKPDKKIKSYWENLNLKKEKIDNYYRQF